MPDFSLIHFGVPFLKGFVLMASVIFAIGPQNAMLIRQGLRREHPFLIALIFSLCDGLLIALGVLGVGQIIRGIALLHALLVWGGALFLAWFSFRSFQSAVRGGKRLDADAGPNRRALIGAALAVSLLNPGAIVDTVVIVGSVSSAYPLAQALAFGCGALTFSVGFFFALAAFTRALAPWLNRPAMWRAVDTVVGLIALGVALNLILAEGLDLLKRL